MKSFVFEENVCEIQAFGEQIKQKQKFLIFPLNGKAENFWENGRMVINLIESWKWLSLELFQAIADFCYTLFSN